MRRIITFILTITMIFSLTSCSETKDAGGTGVISPTPKDGRAELTILVHAAEYKDLADTKYINEYIDKFEKNFGVDVKLEKIGEDTGAMISPEEVTEYIKKMSTKLSVKNGPELIYTHDRNIYALISEGTVVDLRGKVPNLDKVYDSLLGETVCYAPLGIRPMFRRLNKDALAELDVVEPGIDWTSRDYLAIRDKWVSKSNPLYNQVEYQLAFKQFLDSYSLYKVEENKVVLNTPEVRKKINDIRSYILGGKFQLPEGYKYENYYNMSFEDSSSEYKFGWKYYDANRSKGDLDKGGVVNLFNAKDINDKNAKYGTVTYPQFKDKEAYIYSYGFLVSKNGKNLNLAYEFINGLLADEIQMGMFKDQEFFSGENSLVDYWYYPVNKEIEADILKLEEEYKLDPKATELKAYVLQELKDGRYKLDVTKDPRFSNIDFMIFKDLFKLIMADEPYSDEQLQLELKKLEDKYNIYLNE